MTIPSTDLSPPASPSALRTLMTRERWLEVARIVAVGLIALLYSQRVAPLPVLIAAVLLGLYPLVKVGVLDLIHERKIGTELFITVATTIAMIGGEYVAGAVLLSIILIAEFIADLNTDRARASIQALIGAAPQTALVRRAGTELNVPISKVNPGETVIVRAGERIPVDGTVLAGTAAVNQAPITGESVPVEKRPGDGVFAGTVVDLGALDVRTDKLGSDTLFARIINLVENAEASQAPVQKLADRVAAWLIPLVFVFLLVVYLVTRDLRLIITLLIFTSPAELGLATPLVIIAAIARAARAGILLKGGLVLEQLAKVDVLAFDKTGTLTYGTPGVTGVRHFQPGGSDDRLVALTASVERRSSHPLAAGILKRARELKLTLEEPEDFEVIAGRGVRARVGGQRVLVGNSAFLQEEGVALPDTATLAGTSTVLLAVEGVAVGAIDLMDQVRPDLRDTIERLRASGIKRVVMLTGDNETTAQLAARDMGIDEIHADLLPEDKLRVIQELQRAGHQVAMVGDGINDAPALAQADVGIAMGAAGTQAALEAADVALMTDDLGKIVEARVLAARAYRTIQENLFVGVGVVHVLGITAALLRYIGPVQAAVLHLGPDILVFLNSVKLLRVRLTREQR